MSSAKNSRFLFVQGGQGERLESSQLSNHLANLGFTVDFKTIPGTDRSLDNNRPLAIRLVGEYCKAHLTPTHPKPEFTRPASLHGL